MTNKKPVLKMNHDNRKAFLFLNILWSLLVCCCTATELSPDEEEFPCPVSFALFSAGNDIDMSTRAYSTDATTLAEYTRVSSACNFEVQMKSSTGSESSSVTYTSDASTGILGVNAGQTPFYWQDNVTPYGFKVSANSSSLPTDQSNSANFASADYLLGYGYEPLLDSGSSVDGLDDYNYHSFKDWVTMNNVWYSSSMDKKTVPLFVKHQNAWVTVILKAGAGIERSEMVPSNFSSNFYSYNKTTYVSTTITPYKTTTTVDYLSTDFGGAQSGVSTVRFDALIKPAAYSGRGIMVFTFNVGGTETSSTYYYPYASLDPTPSNWDLESGDHLTLTITLTRRLEGDILAFTVDSQRTAENWFDTLFFKSLEEVSYSVGSEQDSGDVFEYGYNM